MPSAPLPVLPNLTDSFARRINYLRVSITDRCNFRCTYCMPNEGIAFNGREALLTFEEIERLVEIFAGLGVVRVRITGGEPTVRAGVVDVISRIASVDGIEEVVMTTNAVLLGGLARPLAAAGLVGVNVSLDTVDAGRFRELTRRGDLAQVIAGIDAALDAGLRVKLNAVALPETDAAEISAICAFAWERGIVPRFIEHMPMSAGSLYSNAGPRLDAQTIRVRVEAAFGGSLSPVPSEDVTGPARYWMVGGDIRRRFGIISAMTEHFCDTCNRLRMSATGDLHACLAYDDATSLRDVMRAGATNEEVRQAIVTTVQGKRRGHEFEMTGGGAPTKHMVSIGG